MGLDLGFDADEPAPQNAAACRCSTRGFRCTCCYEVTEPNDGKDTDCEQALRGPNAP